MSFVKHYIEYYQQDSPGNYAPCVGTNSVIDVDNRNTMTNIIKRGFEFKYKPKSAVGFKICRGTRILDCKPITGLFLIK